LGFVYTTPKNQQFAPGRRPVHPKKVPTHLSTPVELRRFLLFVSRGTVRRFPSPGPGFLKTAPLQKALPKSPNVGQDSRPQMPELPERNVDLNGVHFLKRLKISENCCDGMDFQNKT